MSDEILAAFSLQREETARQRSRLVEITKALRNADDAGRLANLNKTMKAFQSEIERLTERGNFAEAAYMKLLQAMQGASPSVSLESAAESEPDVDAESTTAVGLDALRAALADSREREAALKKRAITRVREQKQLLAERDASLQEAGVREAELRGQLQSALRMKRVLEDEVEELKRISADKTFEMEKRITAAETAAVESAQALIMLRQELRNEQVPQCNSSKCYSHHAYHTLLAPIQRDFEKLCTQPNVRRRHQWQA